MHRSMNVRALTPNDVEAVYRIAAQNGLLRWEWPKGSHGAVAVIDGEIVAFCAAREILTGLVVDEFWPERSERGIRGLLMLGKWAEQLTARLGAERGEDLNCGGIVANNLTQHAAALIKHGYEPKAVVYAKVISREAL